MTPQGIQDITTLRVKLFLDTAGLFENKTRFVSANYDIKFDKSFIFLNDRMMEKWRNLLYDEIYS